MERRGRSRMKEIAKEEKGWVQHMFERTVNEEKVWADYLFKQGSMIGLMIVFYTTMSSGKS